MIQTIHYTATQSQDGKQIHVPNPYGLMLNGPVIQVQITSSQKVIEINKKNGVSTSAVTVQALIDTGASNSIISTRAVESLNLAQTGFMNITSVQDQ